MEQQETKRIDMMKEHISEEKDVLLNERIKKITQLYSGAHISSYLEEILAGLTMGRKEGALVISYLHSSYFIESHRFMVAYYSEEPFVEEEPDCVYYDMQPYMEGLRDDWKILCEKITEKYKPTFTWEKEEIRRWYSRQVYEGCGAIFRGILKSMKKKNELPIYYGGYMDELEIIGTI